MSLIKRKEEELRIKEEKLLERERLLIEKENQILEREAFINEMLKGGLRDSGKELMRSMQRMASTRAGESSLAVSERVSLGSKLKESKMSGYSGYDSAG